MPDSAAMTCSAPWDTARELIDRQLDLYSRFEDGCPHRLSAAIRYCLLAPGKRLRPLLVLMSCQACGGEMEQALAPACAVEMVHTYSLIHDDLPAMDDDDVRRGQPSCHVQFDEATAILAGDALLARAFEVLAVHTRPPAIAARCVAALSAAAGACRLVGGQADDLDRDHNPATLQQLENVHRRKTGALLCASVQLGGIVGGADAPTRQALQEYGENLGLAFQIVDDMLDIEADPGKTGKRIGQDQQPGKLTYPALLGIQPSRQRAQRLIDAAIASLAPLGSRAEPLGELACFVVQRDH